MFGGGGGGGEPLGGGKKEEPTAPGVSRVRRSTMVRDVQWRTASCPLSWSGLGAYRPGAEASVRAMARQNKSGACVQAVGTQAGRVRLLPYPCPDPSLARGGELVVPSREASHVAFAHDDSFLIVAGGSDAMLSILRSVKITDLPGTDATLDRVLSRPLSLLCGGLGAAEGVGPFCCFICTSPHHTASACPSAGALALSPGKGVSGEDALGGTHTLAVVKPFLNALFAPTGEASGARKAEVAVRPDLEVVLSFLHAYRGRDLLHNLFGLQSGELAYVAAGLVVVADFGIEVPKP